MGGGIYGLAWFYDKLAENLIFQSLDACLYRLNIIYNATSKRVWMRTSLEILRALRCILGHYFVDTKIV